MVIDRQTLGRLALCSGEQLIDRAPGLQLVKGRIEGRQMTIGAGCFGQAEIGRLAADGLGQAANPFLPAKLVQDIPPHGSFGRDKINPVPR